MAGEVAEHVDGVADGVFDELTDLTTDLREGGMKIDHNCSTEPHHVLQSASIA